VFNYDSLKRLTDATNPENGKITYTYDDAGNLKTKLENLNLTPQQRSQYSSQLQDLETREQYLANQRKAKDNAELTAYQKALSAQATSTYNAERAATEKSTGAKLAARQQQMEGQMRQQVTALGGKFQQQLAAANTSLTTSPQMQSRLQAIHGDIQSKYEKDAEQALINYHAARQALVARYSAIAHTQFQDNQAVATQVDQLAAKRRDLYAKIVQQIQNQVQQVAHGDGVAIVFGSIAASGSAVDLTDQVIKRVAALSGSTAPAAGR